MAGRQEGSGREGGICSECGWEEEKMERKRKMSRHIRSYRICVHRRDLDFV